MVSTRHSKLQQPEGQVQLPAAADSDDDAPEEVDAASSKAQETVRTQHIKEAAVAASAAKRKRRGAQQASAEQRQSATADDADADGDQQAAAAVAVQREAAVQPSADAAAGAAAAASSPEIDGEDRLPDEVVAELLRRQREAAAAGPAAVQKQQVDAQPSRKRLKAQRQQQTKRRIGSVTVKALDPRQRLPSSGVALAFRREQDSRVKRSQDMLYPTRAAGSDKIFCGPAISFV